MANADIAPLVDAITAKVETLLGSESFIAWVAGKPSQPGDLVLLNNSFLFREGIRTTKKSNLYLGVPMDGVRPLLPPTVLSSERAVNASFKRVASRSVPSYLSTSLIDAVEPELQNLGKIVFALVGAIGERQPVTVPLASVGGCERLRFDPSQDRPVVFDGTTLSVRQLDEIDELWTAAEGLAKEQGFEFEADAAEAFDKAFTMLQEEAGRPIDIEVVTKEGPSVLTEVLARIDEQTAAYKTSLDRYKLQHDPEALGEILRISYNFADGAKLMLTLIVGLSDLKPLLFWLTVLEQYQLADRFGELPFSLVGKAKPSIDRYRGVIAGARNRAFHDVFGFVSPFQVRLTGEAFRTPQLRLFREYSRRREPALEYEDRELVDLLEEFTRAQERPVPKGFWEKNYEVMRAVADVGRGMQEALVLCHDVIGRVEVP